MNSILRITALACGLIIGPAAASAQSFSCAIGKNKKILELSSTPEGVSYSYGKSGAAPELVLTAAIGDIEVSPWSGIGRTITYSVTVFNGEYSYFVYTATDKIDQATTTGVMVEKGQRQLADLQCDPRTVRGDLDQLVMSLDERQSRSR